MKTLVFITTILVCSTSWAAGCISGNCSNGIGTYTWADGNKYVGGFKDGKEMADKFRSPNIRRDRDLYIGRLAK
jgi:hypothetical protein